MEKLSNSIADNLARCREDIAGAALKSGRDPAGIELMAVTKTQTAEAVNAAISAGVTLLGENRAQELNARFHDYVRGGAKIHFIGHLQTNKVKQIIDKVDMIESVGTLKLANEINKHCKNQGIVMDILIEINIGGEESKSGVSPQDAERLIGEISKLDAVKIRGLMTIPPIFTADCDNEHFFSRMKQLQVDIIEKNIDNVSMGVLSMGMSDDFAAAIKHGSTRVRIGTAIFGRRR
jgi:pyridoxal phosphate enzyme (YggS family)